MSEAAPFTRSAGAGRPSGSHRSLRVAGLALFVGSVSLTAFAVATIVPTLSGGWPWFLGTKQPATCGNVITDPVFLAANWAIPLGVLSVLSLAWRSSTRMRVAAFGATALVVANAVVLAWFLAEWKNRLNVELGVWWMPYSG